MDAALWFAENRSSLRITRIQNLSSWHLDVKSGAQRSCRRCTFVPFAPANETFHPGHRAE